ncbi:MAG: type II secretion system protein GspG [Verrucomicrobia bacterium]|nr:type II secretion system protein GspG [Verrucomicrobiota bacterium]
MIAPHKKTSSGGFTLIELLIVITIIAILASLVLAAAGGVQKKGARSRTEAEIAAVGAALESYKADNGDYPAGSSSLVLITNLMPSSGKVYFEFKSKSVDSSGWLDPFGIAYSYRYPGLSNQSGTNFFDLWSTAGGSTATNTWIKNW